MKLKILLLTWFRVTFAQIGRKEENLERIGERIDRRFSGSCFENPILIRRKNRTRQPLELIDFCCKLCSEKGCSACGEEDPALADCPSEVAPYFIHMNPETGCYVNCVCVDPNKRINWFVMFLSSFGHSLQSNKPFYVNKWA
ncbi:unnamed protein product [Oikopleura dioica]|uniref:Uncharacterized protein n=1 Tax=Oikopleura dioica TaxID=34765 RepID=E4XNX1_OIKDI|nr:unnamed protein product [Oikopleura dioica]